MISVSTHTMIICIHHNMSASHAIFLAATSLGLGLFPHTRGLFSKAPIHLQPSSPGIPQASNSTICGVGSSHLARAAALILSHCSARKTGEIPQQKNQEKSA